MEQGQPMKFSDAVTTRIRNEAFNAGFSDNAACLALASLTAEDLVQALATSVPPPPLPMLLWCPECNKRHIDCGEFAIKEHHTHACQSCGHVWRPAIVSTVGVQFLPGFKDLAPPEPEPI